MFVSLKAFLNPPASSWNRRSATARAITPLIINGVKKRSDFHAESYGPMLVTSNIQRPEHEFLRENKRSTTTGLSSNKRFGDRTRV